MNRKAFPGKLYFWFAGVFAVLAAVSTAGLAFRRFVIRPRWLGNLSHESGRVPDFLLMVTYLGSSLVRARKQAAVVDTHGYYSLLLALIPHTKHLHLVLSPFTVFMKRNAFTKIPPLIGEDEFGLRAG